MSQLNNLYFIYRESYFLLENIDFFLNVKFVPIWNEFTIIIFDPN